MYAEYIWKHQRCAGKYKQRTKDFLKIHFKMNQMEL